MSDAVASTDSESRERTLVDNLLEDLTALEQRVDSLEAAADRIAELEERVEELDQRTDMLRLIEESDEMGGRQRSTALIQHAIEESNSSGRTAVMFDHDRAEETLHYPDVHRTTIYSDMERCQRLIGNTDVCEYKKASQTQSGTPELLFNFAGIDDVDASTLIDGGE